MAIKKQTELGDTGLTGEHWAPSDLQLRRTTDGKTKVIGRYAMFASAKAYEAGRAPLRRSRRVEVVLDTTDPKLSDIERAMDKELTRKTVKGQPAVREVKAQPAVKADKKKGIKARGEIKAVKGKAAVRGVRGGELEGGEIV